MSTSPTPRRGLPSAPAAVADKRFRRADVRPGRRGKWLRVWQVGRVVLLMAALAGVGVFASTRAVGARILAVDDLSVSGHHHLTLGEVEALIGDVRGESLLLVDLDRFRAALLGSPWVAAVTLRRVLPSTVDVHIVEREPVAIARIGQLLYLVDDAGVIMDEYGPQYRDFDLSIVDGMAAPRTEEGPPIDPKRAQLVARFFRELDVRPELKRVVSQVNVAIEGNVVVMLADDTTALHLGDAQFVERLQTYLDLTPRFEERGRLVDYVDLRFGDRVFLKDHK
ncbi:MAG: FtsQ-type POTRA domain-containing protein [Acidimicrobiia bacterium]|nr:FtsQ-type POTRA domain-containing protein [Acidimicrobiia bacterium]